MSLLMPWEMPLPIYPSRYCSNVILSFNLLIRTVYFLFWHSQDDNFLWLLWYWSYSTLWTHVLYLLPGCNTGTVFFFSATCPAHCVQHSAFYIVTHYNTYWINPYLHVTRKFNHVLMYVSSTNSHFFDYILKKYFKNQQIPTLSTNWVCLIPLEIPKVFKTKIYFKIKWLVP